MYMYRYVCFLWYMCAFLQCWSCFKEKHNETCYPPRAVCSWRCVLGDSPAVKVKDTPLSSWRENLTHYVCQRVTAEMDSPRPTCNFLLRPDSVSFVHLRAEEYFRFSPHHRQRLEGIPSSPLFPPWRTWLEWQVIIARIAPSLAYLNLSRGSLDQSLCFLEKKSCLQFLIQNMYLYVISPFYPVLVPWKYQNFFSLLKSFKNY